MRPGWPPPSTPSPPVTAHPARTPSGWRSRSRWNGSWAAAEVPPWLAGSIVFFSSAAVLILEILAGRLLAPYVGIRLETYTAVIGVVLAGISVGTWLGGRLADRVDPRRTVGPLLVAGGVLALTSVPLVRALGTVGSAQAAQTLTLTLIGFGPSAAVLSAVSPTVVKLQLHDLDQTGQIVGRLSALGTAGAIAGTFTAGFVLVAAAATTTVIGVVGGALIAAGIGLWWFLARPRPSARQLAVAVALSVGAASLGAVSDGPCDTETRYHCVRLSVDPDRAGGRELRLDVLRHSYVDLDDPTHLELRYAKAFADVINSAELPDGERLDVLHVGGGGFTMPRYLRATRPGSDHLVLEIDPGLVEVARERLGLVTGPELRVQVGDARVRQLRLPDDTYELVLGDAFGDLAVPWHLATVEYLRDLARVMRPGGLYLLNLIDHPPLRFARAEVATLREVFDHVAVVAPPDLLAGRRGGNFVVAASDRPFDADAVEDRIGRRAGEEEILTGAAAIDRFAGDGRVLTDDYAPVDQWLAR
ncbi:MAG: fused MFS/spermidine synthase, partial [Acidimicrobiia bacterium]